MLQQQIYQEEQLPMEGGNSTQFYSHFTQYQSSYEDYGNQPANYGDYQSQPAMYGDYGNTWPSQDYQYQQQQQQNGYAGSGCKLYCLYRVFFLIITPTIYGGI